jgi:hypothetical protein
MPESSRPLRALHYRPGHLRYGRFLSSRPPVASTAHQLLHGTAQTCHMDRVASSYLRSRCTIASKSNDEKIDHIKIEDSSSLRPTSESAVSLSTPTVSVNICTFAKRETSQSIYKENRPFRLCKAWPSRDFTNTYPISSRSCSSSSPSDASNKHAVWIGWPRVIFGLAVQ